MESATAESPLLAYLAELETEEYKPEPCEWNAECGKEATWKMIYTLPCKHDQATFLICHTHYLQAKKYFSQVCVQVCAPCYPTVSQIKDVKFERIVVQ